MKRILTHFSHLFLVLSVVVAAQPSSANSVARRCRFVFAKKPIDLLKELRLAKREGLENYRNSSQGQWVEVGGEWFRYMVKGTSGPLRVHFFGLGGELHRSFNENLVLKDYSKSGRVLLIELLGQGLTEVHKAQEIRSRSDREFLSRKRIIDYQKNAELSYLAAQKILERLGENIDSVRLWSGDSFGGANLSGFRQQISSEPLTQFFATPFSPLENYFVQKKTHDILDKKRTDVDKAFRKTNVSVGTQIGLFIVRLILGKQKVVRSEDKIVLDGAVGQYYGFKSVQPGELSKNFPEGSRVQIFTAEKDKVVYPMMHWDVIRSLQNRGVTTTGVLVENINHNLAKNMTEAQRAAVDKMTKNPQDYEGFYVLKTNGQLLKKTPEETLARYKKTSRRIWKAYHERPLTRAFNWLRSGGASYPKSWE